MLAAGVVEEGMSTLGDAMHARDYCADHMDVAGWLHGHQGLRLQ